MNEETLYTKKCSNAFGEVTINKEMRQIDYVFGYIMTMKVSEEC